MKKTGIGFTLSVSALVIAGCRPGQSNADTTNVAASSTPSAAQNAADTNTLNPGGGASGSSTSKTSTTGKRGASSTKVSGRSDTQTQKPVRDSILGYDSVIKFPLKTLPTATSTPRK